jgi:hypothetical protein
MAELLPALSIRRKKTMDSSILGVLFTRRNGKLGWSF